MMSMQNVEKLTTSYPYPWALVFHNGQVEGQRPRTVLAFIHEAVAVDGKIVGYRVTKFPGDRPTKRPSRIRPEMLAHEFRVRRFEGRTATASKRPVLWSPKGGDRVSENYSMANELVRVKSGNVQVASGKAILPELVERAGGAARFAWDEFFYAEHHNPHTQRAYQSAVRRFLAWCEGEGVELASISPGMVGQYLVGLGGSAAKRNLHLSALRGFFDRLVQRHVVLLNPAASVSGVKETVVEGKTPEITIDQARKLIASVKTTYTVKAKGQKRPGGRERRGPAGPGDPRHDGLYRLPGRGDCQAAAPGFPARRRAVRAAVPGEGRQEPGNPGAAGIAAGYTGLSGGGGHRGAMPRIGRCSARRCGRRSN